jgi:hypothetical protein
MAPTDLDARSGALLGRERELSRLSELLSAARSGRGGALALIGEPGVGKTALVSELAATARSSGAQVSWGRCSGLAGDPPWGPVAQALSPLFDEGILDAPMAAACGGGLLALVPEAARLSPELVAPAGADPETIGFGVARATTRLFRQVCLKRPCLLVIDDVHDADPATLRLLATLAHEARTMGLCIVMTAREGELSASPHAAEVAELSRDLAFVRVGALPVGAARALVRRVAPDLAEAELQRVIDVADGNPLYLCELAALVWARATSAEEALPIPVGVKASIRSRLERLPAPTRAFVDALAVLGGRAPTERAAEVARVPASAAGFALELGIAVTSGPQAARLSHPLVREVALASLDAERRAHLHQKAAELAGVRAARGEHEAAGEQVRHLVGCGALGEAVEAALAVAHDAEQRAADDEAVAILSLVYDASESASLADRHTAALAIALGRAQLRSGRSNAGIASCKRAAAIAERIADADLFAGAALARGSVFRFGHVDRGLVEALHRALSLRGPREDALHARLLARLAAAETPSLQQAPVIASAHQAIALARSLGDPRVLLDVLHDAMAACVDYEDPRLRMGPNRELCELARTLRAPWYELRALNRLIFDHADLGDVAGADAVLEQLDAIARSFAHPRHQWRVALLRAMRAVSDGRWAAADRHLDEAVALGGDDPMQPIALLGHRFARLRAQERADDALQLIDDEREVLAAIPDAEAMIATLEAAALARAGRLDAARDRLPSARRFLAFEDLGFTALFAEAAALTHDRDACAAVRPLLAARVGRFASGGPMLMYVSDPVERYLGLVCAELGDRASAIAHLDRALSALRAASALPYVARTARELSALLGQGSARSARSADEHARAAQLDAEARALAERLELSDLRASFAATLAAHVPSGASFSMLKEGETWAITHAGATFRLRDLRGLRILARLIEQQGSDLHVLDLVDGPEEGAIDRGDAGPLLDARTRGEYRARLVDLRDDLAEAERRSDLAWIDRLRTESDAIQAELSRAFSRGGKARRTGLAAERARSAVTRRVREAIARIAEHDARLGEHLEWAVRTGTTCVYRGKAP